MKLFGNRHEPHSRKEKTRSPGKGKRRAVIAVCVIVLAVAAALIGYSIWEKPPELAAKPTPVPTVKPSENVPAIDPTGEPVATEEPVDENEGMLLTDRADGVYTFLLVGVDKASNSTDTIILGRFDTVAHTVDCVNIPRDTLVNTTWKSTPRKINAVYPAGINSGGNGIDQLKEQVKKLCGFDVDCYAVVSLEAVERCVDAVGGVDFDVPVDMFYDDAIQGFEVNLSKGPHHLNGEETLGVFRFRHSYSGGDIQRIGVQQDLMMAIAGKMLSLGSIPNLPEIISILTETVNTDLTAANLAYFARQFLKCSSDGISFHTLPFSVAAAINGVSYVSCDVDAWLELVNASLSPFKDPLTRANVDILTSNGNGTVLNSTTGFVSGGFEMYCSRCDAAGRSPRYHVPGMCPGDAPTSAPEPEPTDTPTEPLPGGEPVEPPADEPPAESEGPVVEEIIVGAG